jgi:hemerythrin-like domain-containing protein
MKKSKKPTAKKKTTSTKKPATKRRAPLPSSGRGGSIKAKVASVVNDSPNSILTLIMRDHGALRESIKVLKNLKADTQDLQRHLQRFLGYLEIHAKTEEATLYSRLAAEEKLHREILEAFEEHGIADYLAKELKGANFASGWSEEIAARAKVVAELVEHHAQEEEEDLFPKVRRLLSREELDALGEAYKEKRAEIAEHVPAEELEIPSRGGRSRREQQPSALR